MVKKELKKQKQTAPKKTVKSVKNKKPVKKSSNPVIDVKITREEAIVILGKTLEKMNKEGHCGSLKFNSPEELAVVHDALVFSLFAFGVPYDSEDLPKKWARYSEDGVFVETDEDEDDDDTLVPQNVTYNDNDDDWDPDESDEKLEEPKKSEEPEEKASVVTNNNGDDEWDEDEDEDITEEDE